MIIKMSGVGLFASKAVAEGQILMALMIFWKTLIINCRGVYLM
jgi:hypothetical protein